MAVTVVQNDELEQLLADLESDRVERKQVLSNKGRIAEAICAFANDLPGHNLPGVILVGARDAGHIAAVVRSRS